MEEEYTTRLIKENSKLELLEYTWSDGTIIYTFGIPNGPYLKTPNGNIVKTMYKELAERIYDDYTNYGDKIGSPDSILSWHYTLLDNFGSLQN